MQRPLTTPGTDNDVAKFFNHLRKDVFDIEHHCMAMKFGDVSRYHGGRRNGRWFEFKWPSFSSPWLFMLAMAALILLLLTFTQAAVAVFSDINPSPMSQWESKFSLSIR